MSSEHRSIKYLPWDWSAAWFCLTHNTLATVPSKDNPEWPSKPQKNSNGITQHPDEGKEEVGSPRNSSATPFLGIIESVSGSQDTAEGREVSPNNSTGQEESPTSPAKINSQNTRKRARHSNNSFAVTITSNKRQRIGPRKPIRQTDLGREEGTPSDYNDDDDEDDGDDGDEKEFDVNEMLENVPSTIASTPPVAALMKLTKIQNAPFKTRWIPKKEATDTHTEKWWQSALTPRVHGGHLVFTKISRFSETRGKKKITTAPSDNEFDEQAAKKLLDLSALVTPGNRRSILYSFQKFSNSELEVSTALSLLSVMLDLEISARVD
ncbi:hypothetical protein B0J14DRAFT_664849 [Halenospora varia]|nr:hypothetical protein B0J14DRAFT_664849 [Halenospora varia]